MIKQTEFKQLSDSDLENIICLCADILTDRWEKIEKQDDIGWDNDDDSDC